MGIKDPKFFVEKHIAEHKERYHSHYDRFLNGEAPINVTWLSVNMDVSTEDIGAENVEGYESGARKYDLIKNLKIYGFDTAEVVLSLGDKGLNGETMSGEVMLLPETIKPKPEDRFVVEHMGSNMVFRVTGVNFPYIKSNNFWVAKYELTSTDGDPGLFENIVDEYDTIYENIGTEFKVVIKKEEMDTLVAVDNLFDRMKRDYLEYYYERRTNAFTYEMFVGDQDTIFSKFMYNKYLHKFLIETSLFTDINSMASVSLTQEANLNRGFNIHYSKTLYYAMMKKDKTRLDSELCDLIYMPITNRVGSLFSAYPDTYITGDILNKRLRDNPDNDEEIFYKNFIPEELMGAIQDPTTTSNELYKIISNYLSGEVLSLAQLKYLESYIMDYNMDDFTILPFIIFILKYNYKYIMSKDENVNNIS